MEEMQQSVTSLLILGRVEIPQTHAFLTTWLVTLADTPLLTAALHPMVPQGVPSLSQSDNFLAPGVATLSNNDWME